MSDLKGRIVAAFAQVFGIPAVEANVEILLADAKRVSKLEFMLANSSAITTYPCLQTLLLALSSVKKVEELFQYPNTKTYFSLAFSFLMKWYETAEARDLHQMGESQRRELETAARRLIHCMHKMVRNTKSNPILFDLNLSVINLGHEYSIGGSFPGAPAFNRRARELIEQARSTASRTKTVYCVLCGGSLAVSVSKTPKKCCATCSGKSSDSNTRYCQRCGKSHTRPDGIADTTWNKTLICHECKQK